MDTGRNIEIVATILFACAISHTFAVSRFQHWAHRFREGSVGENFFHMMGEVEVVFGLWAGIFVAYLVWAQGQVGTLAFLNSLNFTEPVFVFVIMTVCSTRPILNLASTVIDRLARVLPLPKGVAFYFVALVGGPLLGSFITEPAAMTVTALLLSDRVFRARISSRLRYATLGLLFVNISIGGTLTHFAAPPVLMVAPKWGWDLPYMFFHFGWKGVLASVTSAALVSGWFFKELKDLPATKKSRARVPTWVTVAHLLFLALIILNSHHIVLFLGLFLFFLGLVTVTGEFQDELKLREGLLVGFFLGGLVVLGSLQRWWLEPILARLNEAQLFIGTTGLTAVTDNAALTYLGAQVPGLSEAAKYALVAGSVVGGGLTVIANAPNPAGFGILNPTFGEDGISPLYLFASALPFTLISGLCFWFL
jgi:hypothetical protein